MTTEAINELARLLARLDWLDVLDILLVATVFWSLLFLMRGTQAVTLLRGVLILAVMIAVLSSVLRLRAFSWLIRNTLPAIIIAVPVIFQPEIRRALDQLGRASTWVGLGGLTQEKSQPVIAAIVKACQKLSAQKYGGLIVIEREVGVQTYIDTGVPMDSLISPELLIHIFYKDTPLHDGAVIIRGDRIAASACILPLSSATDLTAKQLGLRHRASLGISEVSDAVAVVVSEETGTISVVHNGRIIRRLDHNRLQTILEAFYRPRFEQGLLGRWTRWLRQTRKGQ